MTGSIANILIVDDDKKTLLAMEMLLAGPDRAIVTAHSGPEALRRLLRQDFALILLDVRMPEMDGFETAELIRQRDRSRYTPIIFLSAMDTLESDVLRGVSSGAVDYLFKPVMPQVLKTKVSVFVDLFHLNERLKQQAVRQTEERFRLLVEGLQDYSILMLDPEGRVTTWNIGTERIRGYRSEEIIGQLFAIFYTPEDRAKGRPEQALRQAAIQEHYEEEGWGLRKDGSVFWANVIITAVRDQGNLVGFSEITRDLTKRRQGEERFRVAVEAGPNAMIMVAADGRIALVNGQTEKLFGYTRDEILGLPVDRLVPERYRGRHGGFRDSFFSAPTTRPMGMGRDLYGVRKDGSEVPVEIGLNPMETDEGKFVLASIIDITERKRAQEELQRLNAELERRVAERTSDLVQSIEQREKLQEQLLQAQKMESIGTLAGGIAHDFNNILNIILGYSSVLTDNPSDPVRIREGLGVVRDTVERGVSLVQQLLTFARNGNVNFEPIDINDFLRQFTRLLNETFPKTISLSLEIDPELPSIMADPNRLHQTLLNLCVNARDAMGGTGSLLLGGRTVSGSALRQRFQEARYESYIGITIADTGAGMNRSVRERIFDPFFSTKEQGKGTGLGLTVVYGIVREHDGFIEVESHPGHGTKFHIYLPLRAVDGRRSPGQVIEKRAPQPLEGSGTILFVDDEEHQIGLIRPFLEGKGYRVLVARNGVEAVEIHNEHKDDITAVILDLGLPKLSGWEAFLKMKQNKPEVRTIFTSGYIKPEIKSEMINQGVVEVVQKPYLPYELLAKIHSAIEEPTPVPAP